MSVEGLGIRAAEPSTNSLKGQSPKTLLPSNDLLYSAKSIGRLTVLVLDAFIKVESTLKRPIDSIYTCYVATRLYH